MAKITFENATSRDLERIVAIYNSTIESRMVTADLESVSVESRIEWFNQHNRQTRPLWVVKSENEIIGWVSFQDFYGRPAYNATAEISIYLDKGYRKRGLGRQILSHSLNECSRLGINTLLGFIFGHNEPSLKIFLAAGFEEWGHLPRIAKLDGIERDLKILGKRIP